MAQEVANSALIFESFYPKIAYSRDLEDRRRHALDPSREKFGIPQHFGMYYAMGTGLIIEGKAYECLKSRLVQVSNS